MLLTFNNRLDRRDNLCGAVDYLSLYPIASIPFLHYCTSKIFTNKLVVVTVPAKIHAILVQGTNTPNGPRHIASSESTRDDPLLATLIRNTEVNIIDPKGLDPSTLDIRNGGSRVRN